LAKGRHCQSLCHYLLFHEPGPLSSVEEPDEYYIKTVLNKKLSDDDIEDRWEASLLEEDEDDSESDFVMED